MTDADYEARGWDEIAALMQTSDKTAARLAAAGEIPVYFVGRQPRLRRSTWEATVQQTEREALFRVMTAGRRRERRARQN